MYIKVCAYCMIPCFICSIYIAFCTKKSQAPENIMFMFAILAFVMSIQWISFVSNIVVDLLAMIGIMLDLPKPLLGLTLLAWGNCMGDLNANVAMTKKGFGEMAITGCLAGPIFNILCGLGLSCLKMLINDVDGNIPFSIFLLDLEHNKLPEGKLNPNAVLPFGLICAQIPCLLVILFNALKNEYHIAKTLCMINMVIYGIVITGLVIYTLTAPEVTS